MICCQVKKQYVNKLREEREAKMEHYLPFLNWIDHQHTAMKELVILWSNTNTHATNYEGLQQQMNLLKKSFESLGGTMQELTLSPHLTIDSHGNKVSTPLGKALHIVKRTEAPIKVFLAGHMDTVFAKHSPFQKAHYKDDKTLIGPGVADMKGGLVVMLTALQALEKSPYAEKIGWEVIINPDEEIGSPGSSAIFERAATRNHIGLLFEPAFADGSLVFERSGSMNLVCIVKGKAAHAGRDFEKGKSAVFAAAHFLVELEALSKQFENTTINVGECTSGNSFNIVPDLAIIRINARAHLPSTMQKLKNAILELIEAHNKKHDGITFESIEQMSKIPKIADSQSEKIRSWVAECASHLQMQVQFVSSRGVTDGNTLAGAGLGTIDSLGPIGGELHTHNEFLDVESLTARAKLAALLLMKIGNEEFSIQKQHTVITL
jgi:glutamate carboxypeptidase